MSEPTITINGRALTEAQAMTIRVAIESFATDLREGLGDDDHGRTMTAAYLARISELRRLMLNASRDIVSHPQADVPQGIEAVWRLQNLNVTDEMRAEWLRAGESKVPGRAALALMWAALRDRAQIERLRAALRPLADIADRIDGVPPQPHYPDEMDVATVLASAHRVTLGQARVARRVLEGEQ